MGTLVGFAVRRVLMRQRVGGGCPVLWYLQGSDPDDFVALRSVVGNAPFIFFYGYFSLW